MQHASPSARGEYVQRGRRTQRSAVHVSHVTWASAALWRGELAHVAAKWTPVRREGLANE